MVGTPQPTDSLAQWVRVTSHCHANDRNARLSRPVTVKPSQSECIRWIRRTAKRRTTLSQEEYDDRRPPGAPRARTLQRWTGDTWAALCLQAGITAGTVTPPRWSNQAKIQAVTAAAAGLAAGDDFSRYGYDLWRADQPDPTRYPTIKALGGPAEFRALCQQAGVASGKRRRRVEFSDQVIEQHLIAAGHGDPTAVTASGYDRYRDEHPNAPSRSTIIGRYDNADTPGGWEAAKASAAHRQRRHAAGATPPPARRRLTSTPAVGKRQPGAPDLPHRQPARPRGGATSTSRPQRPGTSTIACQ